MSDVQPKFHHRKKDAYEFVIDIDELLLSSVNIPLYKYDKAVGGTLARLKTKKK